MGGEENGIVPLETVFRGYRPCPHIIHRPHIDHTAFPCTVIQALQHTHIITAIGYIRVEGISYHITTFCSCSIFHIGRSNGGSKCTAPDTECAVVLLSAKYTIGKCIVRTQPVHLCRRLVHIRAPVIPAIK